MWRNITLVVVVSVACITAIHGYSIVRSNEEGSYHYTVPIGPHLELPTHYQQQNQQQRQHRSQYQQQPSALNSLTLTSPDYDTEASAAVNKESVRLPLPLGVASINIEPLPLMEGASYNSPHGLTSYGTTYPQRL